MTLANENPWYVLMTLYGEQEAEQVDWELHDRNKEVWNLWALDSVPEQQRPLVIGAGFSLPGLTTWLSRRGEVEGRHRDEMLRRNGGGFQYPGFPAPRDAIDLSNVEFALQLICKEFAFLNLAEFALAKFLRHTHFGSAVFFRGARFPDAEFRGACQFLDAAFHKLAAFDRASMCGLATFVSSNFQGNALFNGVKFLNGAFFSNTSFGDDAQFSSTEFTFAANFDGVIFKDSVSFVDAKFSCHAVFSKATFFGFSNFIRTIIGTREQPFDAAFRDCHFHRPINFREAVFSRYPDFSGAILHEKATFTELPDYWPNTRQPDPEQAKASCAVIRHNVGKQGLPEAEHFFFRREMGFAAQIGGVLAAFALSAVWLVFGLWLLD